MNIRPVKDIIDNKTNQPIFIKSHAKATFMSNGKTVEDTIYELKKEGLYSLDIIALGESLGEIIENEEEEGITFVNGTLSEDMYNTIIDALENNKLIFNCDNCQGTVNVQYEEGENITLGSHIVLPGTGCLFYDILITINKNTLECEITVVGNQKMVQLDDKQDVLVSGENIKTINGESILGSGDITIDGGENVMEKYITDFTISDILTLYHAETDGEISVKITRELVDAIENGKAIFIPMYREEEIGINFISEIMVSTQLTGDTDKNIGISFNTDTDYFTLSATILDGNEFVELTKGDIRIKDLSKTISISYNELKTLRDNNQLTPGTFYRIDDYITTTVQENTSSAGHPFDVIVLALSENTLSEEAYAIKSKRDTDNYFGTSNLSAWKIWYSLDNDASRFGWADAENGTGVIYRMIDEWNNDVPYDFKNILYTPDIPFVKVSMKAYGSYFSGVINRNSSYDINANDKTYYGWDYSITQGPSSTGVVLTDTLSFSLETVFYTQDSLTPTDVVKVDEVYTQVYTFGYNIDDTLSIMSTHNNTILPYATYQGYWVKLLNSIIFGNACHNNTFGNACHNNTFGNACHNNTFGNACHNNTFGDGCYTNTFGDGCYTNTFGDNCYENTFDIDCNNNTLGDDCNNNTFDEGCGYNKFNKYCMKNTIMFGCSFNIFGVGCQDNAFGGMCRANTMAFYCCNNTLSNSCHYNSFSNNCSYNSITRETMTNNGVLKNLVITNGVGGSSGSINKIIIPDNLLDIDYEIKIAKNSSGEIKMYCEADLIS